MWPQNLASIEDGYSSTDLAWFIYNAFIDEGFVATIVRGKDQHNYWGEHVWVEVKVLQQWIQVDFTPYYRRAMPFLHDTSLQHTSITRGLEKTAFSSWKETPFIALPYAPGDNMPLGMIVDIDIPREIEFFLVVESIQNNTVKLIGRVFQNTYATTTFKEQTPLYNVVVEIDLQKMKTWIRAQEDSSCLSQDCTRDMLAQRVDIQEDGTGFFKSHMEISRVYNKELDANDASQLEYLLVRAALAMVLPDLVQTKKE
ncbi:MAG: hypothetical protein KDK51_05585 [Deltaproteobacteria bacterium]|nr:hypothetical protein [Deltaproteobacteria bacterium]